MSLAPESFGGGHDDRLRCVSLLEKISQHLVLAYHPWLCCVAAVATEKKGSVYTTRKLVVVERDLPTLNQS
jgi:hypothetical protein